MQTNCVEMVLDGIHVPPRLVAASLRCIIHTLLMLRLPHGAPRDEGSPPLHRPPRGPRRPRGPPAAGESSRESARGEPAVATAASASGALSSFSSSLRDLHGGRVGGQQRVPASGMLYLRSPPSDDDDDSSSSSSSSSSFTRQIENYAQHLPVADDRQRQPSSLTVAHVPSQEYGQIESLLEIGRRPPPPIRSSSCVRCGGRVRSCSSSISSSGSSCSCKEGSLGEGETVGFHLHPHLSPPLTLVYLRLCESPHLTETVEAKLRAFTGKSSPSR